MSDVSQPRTSGATASASPARERTPFWDNARFACIVLVVLGHAVQPMISGSDVALAAYLLIFAFHMPALAVISGYFSRSGAPSSRQMARVLTDIVAPYLIFEGLWMLTMWAVQGQANPNITQPSWTLWFLLSLAIFRLVLPYLALLRWPMVWAIAIAAGAGYLPNINSTLSLSRTLGLLPFFLLGWWLAEHGIVDRLRLLHSRPWWVLTAAIAVLVIAGVSAWAFVGTWEQLNLRGWLFYKADYAALGATQWWAGGVRLGLMAVAVVLGTAFLVLVPRGPRWWTRFGQYTMYVYLLHTFVLYPIRQSGLLSGAEPMWLWLPVVSVAAVLIALGLASRPVRTIFRPLIEPRPRWLFADPTLVAREGRGKDPTGAQRSATRTDASAS